MHCKLNTSISVLLLLALSFKTFAGSIISTPTPDCPSCRDFLIETSRILPELYKKKAFDSIEIFLARRQSSCPNELDVFCFKILLLIETKKFSDHDLDLPGLYSLLQESARITTNFKSGNCCMGYYSSKNFTGERYAFPLFGLIKEWAEDLMNSRTLDSTEQFLCKVLAGDISRPAELIIHQKVNYRFLENSLLRAYHLHRMDGDLINASLLSGIWLPTGNLKKIGAHPKLGLQFGWRNKRNQLDLFFSGVFLNTPQDLNLLVNDTLHSGHLFNGWGFGLEYNYYILHKIRWEAGLTTQFGMENIAVGYKPVHSAKDSYSQTIAYPLGIGLRINYFYSPYIPDKYIGLAAKFNFLNYGSIGGNNLNGNLISIELYYGGNSLKN